MCVCVLYKLEEMELPGRKRARQESEMVYAEIFQEEDDPIPCARDRVEPQFKSLSFYEQALWQQWHNKSERERREWQEKNDEEENVPPPPLPKGEFLVLIL